MRSPVNHALPLVLIAAIAGGSIVGGVGAHAKSRPAPPPVNGPAADYPVVLGEPFQIGGTTWSPEDRLNYDAVGYAAVGVDGGEKISAAHKTLPLPSYVEITSLTSGRTILVRVERRGPMDNDRLIELSPGAVAQLGLAGSARPAVRVRRVNPPEQERALLRAGSRAPERMETPKGLLDALNRKLNAGSQVLSPKPVATPAPQPIPRPAPTPRPKPIAAPTPAPSAMPTAAPPRPAARGSLVVQVGAFSTQARAQGVAGKLGGRVSPAGRVWRVRLGPFAAQAQAQAALGKAKAAGYSDARIQRAD